jgi:hypothetical protein
MKQVTSRTLFERNCCLLNADFFLGLFCDLKLEARFSSEASVNFQLAARHYIPEDKYLHNHRYENLRS